MHASDTAGLLLGVLLGIGLLLVWMYSIGWAYGDAEARGKSGCLVAILVAFLSWPFGLIVWLVFRPDDTRTENRRTAYVACQCGRRVAVEERMAGTKVTCPSCGATLVVPPLSQLQAALDDEGNLRR
jgi:DNA-directed RNA polymerase subunit RPC12/RpoP